MNLPKTGYGPYSEKLESTLASMGYSNYMFQNPRTFTIIGNSIGWYEMGGINKESIYQYLSGLSWPNNLPQDFNNSLEYLIFN